MTRCLGIFREVTNSPNREHDDTLILKSVSEELAKLDAEIYLAEPENVERINPAEWDIILPMCENPPALKTIKSWEGKTLVLNSAESVRNCYRVNMTPRLLAAGIHPHTELFKISQLPKEPPHFAQTGAWIKRGDVHNMTDHDVVFAAQWKEAAKICAEFATRGITHVAVQEHIRGDIIKFYGVGPGEWFAWFYHRPQEIGGYIFDKPELARLAAKAASALELEIFGGDAVVTPEGRIYVIDINSWPSFARVRAEAKVHIARHAHKRAAAAKRKIPA
ncbi:MAG: hypothetical protein WC421_07960 [Elusimicrobiales bacterium]